MFIEYEPVIATNKRGDSTGIQLDIPEMRSVQSQESADYHFMDYPVGY